MPLYWFWSSRRNFWELISVRNSPQSCNCIETDKKVQSINETVSTCLNKREKGDRAGDRFDQQQREKWINARHEKCFACAFMSFYFSSHTFHFYFLAQRCESKGERLFNVLFSHFSYTLLLFSTTCCSRICNTSIALFTVCYRGWKNINRHTICVLSLFYWKVQQLERVKEHREKAKKDLWFIAASPLNYDSLSLCRSCVAKSWDSLHGLTLMQGNRCDFIQIIQWAKEMSGSQYDKRPLLEKVTLYENFFQCLSAHFTGGPTRVAWTQT